MKSKSDTKRLYALYSFIFLAFTGIFYYVMSGRTCILVADGYSQYFPVYVYIGKYIRNIFKGILSGHFVLKQYDFTIGLGEEIIPTLNYYGFGNPIYLLSAFIPAKYAEFGYNLIIFVQLYLGGIAYIFYARRKKCSTIAILASVFFFLFNGYTLNYGISYPPYLTILITIPLLCYGIEKCVEEEKFNIIIVLVMAMQAMSGFYHLYMLGIFGGLYTLIFAWFSSGGFKEYIVKVLRVYGGFILGMMVAGVILCPSMLGFFHSSRLAQKTVMQSLQELWAVQGEVFKNIFRGLVIPNIYDSSSVELQCSLFMLLPIIACWKKIRNIPLKVMFILLNVMYVFTPISSYVMSGFPDQVYYNRWLSIFLFTICIMTCKGIDEIEKIHIKGIILSFVAFYGYLFIIAIVEKKSFLSYCKDHWKFLLIIMAGYILWMAFVVFKKKGVKLIFLSVNLIYIIAILFFLMKDVCAYRFYKLAGDAWNDVQQSRTQLYENKDDEDYWRIDIEARCINQSTIQEYYGVQEYYSIMNAAKIDFFVNYALSQHPVSYRVYNLSGFHNLQDLLCVKYYQDIEDKNQINYNEDAFPLGVTFDNVVSKQQADTWEIWQRIYTAKDTLIIDKEGLVENQEGSSHIPMTDLKIVDNRISGNLVTDHDTYLLMQIPYSQGWKAYVNGVQKEVYIADYGFMTVELESGENRIEFVYSTPGLMTGFICSIVGILLMLVLYRKRGR